jgi:methionyl aminopeptidase
MCRPCTLGYRGFGHASCISVNEVVCHGIPSGAMVLKRGDLVNIDVTVIIDGWHGRDERDIHRVIPRRVIHRVLNPRVLRQLIS